jgi:hypothetical protein
MSHERPDATDLDARMRRLFAGLDTSPGFEERVMARVGALAVPAAELRALVERRREQAERGLRVAAWTQAGIAAGIGVAALALVWRHGAAIAQWTKVAFATADPVTLMPYALIALSLAVWLSLQPYLSR